MGLLWPDTAHWKGSGHSGVTQAGDLAGRGHGRGRVCRAPPRLPPDIRLSVLRPAGLELLTLQSKDIRRAPAPSSSPPAGAVPLSPARPAVVVVLPVGAEVHLSAVDTMLLLRVAAEGGLRSRRRAEGVPLSLPAPRPQGRTALGDGALLGQRAVKRVLVNLFMK